VGLWETAVQVSHDLLSAEAAFLLAVATLLVSAHLHHSTTNGKRAAAGASLSADAFARAVRVSLGHSGGSGALPKDWVLAAYRNAAAYPLVGGHKVPPANASTVAGAVTAAASAMSKELGSALGRLHTFFPASAAKPPPPGGPEDAAPEARSGALRTLFTGTPRKQLDPTAHAPSPGETGGRWPASSRQARASLGHALAAPSPRLLSPLLSPPGSRNSPPSATRSKRRRRPGHALAGKGGCSSSSDDEARDAFPDTAEALAEMMAAPPPTDRKATKRRPWSTATGCGGEPTAAGGAPLPFSSAPSPGGGGVGSIVALRHLLQSPEAVEMMQCPTPRSDHHARSDRAKKPLFSPEAIEMGPLAPADGPAGTPARRL
jgi:hypothetical protein